MAQATDCPLRAHASLRIPLLRGKLSRVALLGGWVAVLILLFGAASAQAVPEPPSLEGLSISPRTVNVTSAAATVTVTAHILDRGPGVSVAFVTFFPPKNHPEAGQDLDLVSGTAVNGMYKAEVVIPRGAYPGIWNLQVEARDVQGNIAKLEPPELEAKGFPGTINVE